VNTARILDARREFADWMRLVHGVKRMSGKMVVADELNDSEFVTELRQRVTRRDLTPAKLSELRAAHRQLLGVTSPFSVQNRALERTVANVVESEYGLDAHQRQLLRATAPPRSPLQYHSNNAV
jgi:hypothetical protein